MSAKESNEPLETIELNNHRKITILGTAHVSQASADKVKELIATQAFDAVAVELCPSRYKAIIEPDQLAKMDLFQVIRQGQAYMVAASLALGAFQQRMAESMGIEPGAEMRTAIRDAQAASLPVILIDREIGVTLKRIYHNFPWWQRFGLFGGLLASIISRETPSTEEIERLKEGDVLESTFSQLAENQQDLYQPLIAERDQYMSARLLQEIAQGQHQHTLAIVGAGHMQGIGNLLRSPDPRSPNEVINELDVVPQRSRWIQYAPWVIVALILTGFFLGFQRGPEIGLAMVIDWVLINGGLSAMGALIALAHPLTIVTAFLAAPLTSLNPMVGAGMVAAAAEIYLRKPKVSDFMRLRHDTVRLSGWWQNRVTRTLLVFLLASFGSAIGTYVAGFRIFDRLSGN
ncbi:TraB/GumN family protein [Nitrosomonas mobilis]|uniref:TraB family protein n=1 Tax=Nitrosomonas mobilis TaxID=51642 RepID=A0A1G5SER0_9PROT|nr:TraB/GumN family protein [Nitrosomonas mobilis]SCZ85684.1 TraB family protein [Nitrosomonas mobilis]HNO74788.1 TraB/GumN family protein [Nitrosomonas mobilis]